MRKKCNSGNNKIFYSGLNKMQFRKEENVILELIKCNSGMKIEIL